MANPFLQVVVPSRVREELLKASPNQSGHMGVHKLYDYIFRYFFWPCVKRDVSGYIKTCHTCQTMGKPNQIRNINLSPLSPIPAIAQPFEDLMIIDDLLRVMCQSTRYPAAYLLRIITAKALTVYFNLWNSKSVSK